MTQLYKVTLPVGNIERAVRFYGAMLSTAGERITPDWHYFRLGEMTLALCQAPGGPNTQPVFIATRESLVHLQARAAMQGAMQVDAEVRLLPTGERGFMLRDPSGNPLCIVEAATAGWRPELPRAAEARHLGAAADVLPLQREFVNAVKGGELARVRELIAVDPELAGATDAGGVSVLMLAAYKRHAAVAEYLLSIHREHSVWEAAAFGLDHLLVELLDADPTLATQYSVDGFTPLGLACYFGHPACVGLLLQRGADVNAAARNTMQVRPLHSALSHRDTAIARIVVEQLLDAGAEVNATQQGGYTALHQAADRGDLALVQMLLAAGADAAAAAANGRTARDLARAQRHQLVYQLLTGVLVTRGEPA